MKYIKYMPSHSMRNGSRNRREILTACKNGFDVSVFCHDTERQGLLLPESVPIIYDGVMNLPRKGAKWKKALKILKNRVIVFNNTRKLDADVLSCHDIAALRSAYIATRFMSKKPQLIYDSHEFEIGRNSNRSRFQTWEIMHWERFLIKRCAFTIVENQLIADEIAKVHHLKQKPVAIRSTPDNWKIEPEISNSVRKELFKEFDKSVQHIIMYHGVVGSGRGIGILCDVVARMPGIGLLILGPKDVKYAETLKSRIGALSITNRVIIHDAVPQPDLWKYIGAADISMALIEPVSRSYELTLPNKVLESIQSLTPVIMSDLPGMREVNNEYQIGLSCDPNDVDSVCECVRTMIEDHELYEQFKKNLIKAKRELCWENEEGRLIMAWKQYLN